jgi:pimeloyl-ACP methyl ester carboxylesterase
LIGHSEGGIVAPMVATSRKDISFLILLAGPGIKNIDLMTEQNIAILESSGIRKAAATAYGELYKKILTDVVQSADSAAAITAAGKSLNDWIEKTGEPVVKELDLLLPQKQEDLVKTLVQTLYTPWFRFFISYDPVPALEKIKCPVLVLNGSKDIQVLPASNLNSMKEALKKAGNKKVEIKEIPQLNHLFQTCNTCTLQEYSLLTETFSPVALQIISEWLNKNVK